MGGKGSRIEQEKVTDLISTEVTSQPVFCEEHWTMSGSQNCPTLRGVPCSTSWFPDPCFLLVETQQHVVDIGLQHVRKDSGLTCGYLELATSATSSSVFFITLPGQQLLSGILRGVTIESTCMDIYTCRSEPHSWCQMPQVRFPKCRDSCVVEVVEEGFSREICKEVREKIRAGKGGKQRTGFS